MVWWGVGYMKRKLHWGAFFFMLTISGTTLYFGGMLFFVWKPDWLMDGSTARFAPAVYYTSIPLFIYGTIGSLFTGIKK